MLAASASILIPAPVDDVFAFFDDLDNVLEFNPLAERITSIERLPDGRLRCDVQMRAGNGQEFTVRYEQTERQPPIRIVTKAHGPSWTAVNERRFVQEGSGTRLTVRTTVQYRRRFLGTLVAWLRGDLTRTQLELDAVLMAQRERITARHP